MALAPVVALDIGTSRIIALVAEMREDGNIMITGMGEHPSIGMRKGEIIDLENAAICVRAALGMAEETGKVSIRQVHLSISGGHIQSIINRGAVPVIEKSGEITQDDIDQVMDVACAVNLPPDRDILHTICQHYCIDEQDRVIKPEGMEGARLSLDVLILHGVRNRLRNTVRVVRNIPVGVEDVVFSALCSALSVLTPEQKKRGVVVIDMGAGTTDYLAYADNVVAAAGVLGLGGDHITNDITIAFNIPTSRAEQLKRDSGCAIIDGASTSQRVALPPEDGFPGGTVSLPSLHTVINVRVDEMLGTIKKHLDSAGILHHVGAGVVLTGGGAYLRDITKLAESIFGLPCSMGKPRNVSGLATATGAPEYATSTGLAQYAFKTITEQDSGSQLGSWVKALFGR